MVSRDWNSRQRDKYQMLHTLYMEYKETKQGNRHQPMEIDSEMQPIDLKTEAAKGEMKGSRDTGGVILAPEWWM